MARKDEKTAQIIQAATREFLTKGLDAASMHNIAGVAEVSKRTLYKYYPTKEDLYYALVDELLDRVHDMYQISYTQGDPFRQQLEKIADKKIEFTTSESFINISKIVIGEMFKSRKVTDDQLEKMYASEALFVKWIDAAKADGKVTSKMDSEVIANQFHYLMKGEVFWPIMLGFADLESIDAIKVRNMIVEFFMNSFCN
jgi:TetR/AcrR family transcriptional regulator of autoinduction and epiphytic fitness